MDWVSAVAVLAAFVVRTTRVRAVDRVGLVLGSSCLAGSSTSLSDGLATTPWALASIRGFTHIRVLSVISDSDIGIVVRNWKIGLRRLEFSLGLTTLSPIFNQSGFQSSGCTRSVYPDRSGPDPCAMLCCFTSRHQTDVAFWNYGISWVSNVHGLKMD